MGKLRHREVKWLAQDHTAKKWQSQDLNPGSLAPELCSQTLPPAASVGQKAKIQEAGTQTPTTHVALGPTLSLSEGPHTMRLPSEAASAPRSARGERSQSMIQAGEEEAEPRCPALLFKGIG